MAEKDETNNDCKEKHISQIAQAISNKVVERIEQHKNKQEVDIGSLRIEAEKAKQDFSSAILRLKILYEGQTDKVNLLEKNYHDVLKNLTIINTKFNTINKEIGKKFKHIEDSFIVAFEDDENVRSALREIVKNINSDRRRMSIITDKILGEPYGTIKEGTNPLIKRVDALEAKNEKQTKLNKYFERKIRILESEVKTLKNDIEILSSKTRELEQKRITKKLARLSNPLKKVFNEIVVAIAKSIVIKLLLFIIITLELMPYIEDYVKLIIDDLF